MLYRLEVAQCLAYGLLLHIQQAGRQAGSHRVVEVVAAVQRQFVGLHREFLLGGVERQLPVVGIGLRAGLVRLGKGVALRLEGEGRQLLVDDGVVVPVDKGVVLGLVAYDAELGVHIVLHLVVVAVEVVGRDVEQHGDIGLEVVHVVELETAQLDDVVVVVAGSHLQGQTLAHVTGQAYL